MSAPPIAHLLRARLRRTAPVSDVRSPSPTYVVSGFSRTMALKQKKWAHAHSVLHLGFRNQNYSTAFGKLRPAFDPSRTSGSPRATSRGDVAQSRGRARRS